MHKYYDPRLFDVMSEEEMKIEFAPKERDGAVMSEADVQCLSDAERCDRAVDVTTAEHFIASGFDVTFVGSVEEEERSRSGSVGMDSCGVFDQLAEGRTGAEVVDAETFFLWLDSSEFRIGERFQRWWVGLPAANEGTRDAEDVVLSLIHI